MSIDDLKQYKIYTATPEAEIFYPVRDYPNPVRKNKESEPEGRVLKGILQDLEMEEKMTRKSRRIIKKH